MIPEFSSVESSVGNLHTKRSDCGLAVRRALVSGRRKVRFNVTVLGARGVGGRGRVPPLKA